MSLLREIQNSAVSSDESVASLLRKCKILAARLGSIEFKEWVDYELNGYPRIEDIPKYRIITIAIRGDFSGAFGSGLTNGEIPLSCIPDEFKETLAKTHFAHPVSSLESLIEESDGGSVKEYWPADVTRALGRKVYRDMTCLQAWKVIPTNRLIGILDIIRNKVLSFVLEIEGESPDAGDAPVNSNPVAEETVKQIFNTYITGNVQNLATGNKRVKQNAVIESNPQLFSDLLDALTKIESDKKHTSELINIVEEMKSNQGNKAYKEHYNDFMSVLANHIQVYGPVVAPFLPALAQILP